MHVLVAMHPTLLTVHAFQTSHLCYKQQGYLLCGVIFCRSNCDKLKNLKVS